MKHNPDTSLPNTYPILLRSPPLPRIRPAARQRRRGGHRREWCHSAAAPVPPPAVSSSLTSSLAAATTRFATQSSIEGPTQPPPNSRLRSSASLYVLFGVQRMNLTAVTDEGEVMTRHVADSLSDWKFTLLESMRKRCSFLERAVEIMGLSNVDVVCDRAEIVGQSPDFREAYDVAVARAVAEQKVLAEHCLLLVRVDGLFIAAKGHDPHDEINSAKSAVLKLGASMLQVCDVESMGHHGRRTAVVYLKGRITPKKYPRHPGTPSKVPL
ncbi:hypothetical protein ABZP36_021240 [Zizania latifolia]